MDFIPWCGHGWRAPRSLSCPPQHRKKDGTLISKIVPSWIRGHLRQPRNDVDYIITESGIAHLKGETLRGPGVGADLHLPSQCTPQLGRRI